jgi:hypothetical protein
MAGRCVDETRTGIVGHVIAGQHGNREGIRRGLATADLPPCGGDARPSMKTEEGRGGQRRALTSAICASIA